MDPTGEMGRDGEAFARAASFALYRASRVGKSEAEREILASRRASTQDSNDAQVTLNEDIRERKQTRRNPNSIRFSQKGVSKEFTDRKSFKKTVNDIKNGNDKNIPPVRVIKMRKVDL